MFFVDHVESAAYSLERFEAIDYLQTSCITKLNRSPNFSREVDKIGEVGMLHVYVFTSIACQNYGELYLNVW